MRALFLLLLLANAALFGWNWYQDRVLERAAPEPPSMADEGRGLRLLSDVAVQPLREDRSPEAPAEEPAAGPESAEPETPARPEPTEAAEPSAPDEPKPSASPPRCFRAGQIDARASRDELVAFLEERGIEARTGTEKGHGESHWVLLPPFPNTDMARNLMDRLREKGVKDLYLVPSGENRNAISLGVFKERPRADERLARIRRLGFDAEMRSLPLPSTRYWVRFSWSGERGDPPLAKMAEAAGVELEEVDCR